MRSCRRARGAAGWAAPLLLLWQCLPTARPYNLDTQHGLLFRGGNGTFFGYSVLLHRHGEEPWLVVGAPRAIWPANTSVDSPGAIFRCRISGNPHGQCEQLQLDFARKFGENYGSCQAGISSFYIEDLIIMGAPGSFYWTGSVFVYNTTANTIHAYTDSNNQVKFGSYLGYSVGAGHFLTPASTEVIGGAPQQEQTGKAYIFSIERQLNILFELRGKKLGSYFGAAVCAVDLNSDGLSDLLVGAPMQSTIREEGRVYVYINSGLEAQMIELNIELSGSDSYAARFGESIANLGDIDNDGFEDVAIGAPQEDNLIGAIYIYNGREDGITPSFSQRIQGHQISNSLSMFGQSIASGIDADNNGYQDVAVGAFFSDSAVVLRPHDKKTYLAVGSMKTLLLNVSLLNVGDDAYETVLHIQIPKGLHFIRVLELEEKQIHCEVLDKEIHAVKLECSVGYLYVDQKSKLDYSFLLDASSFTRAEEDLDIIINATCKNEDGSMLLDNTLTLTIPLKYEIELNTHGFVSPALFVYGTEDKDSPVTCMKENINFTFHVISVGPSMSPNTNLEIMIPNAFPPMDFKLFNTLDIKTTVGQCFYNIYPRNCIAAEKTENILKDVVTFFSKPAKRQMDDASALKFEVRATAWPEKNAKVIELHKDKQVAYVRILLMNL
ncbi:hypothetical protein WISP_122700 [Willisornis vidua]|uniref:ITA4 protein n=1 Tax=Willisornis vidua TaxID=1566151 RepID=A0ABQ9CY34_9PASS|nr:hypothetical protein WISP_122700 [Willisornis vidua]